jgi:hypothetical protein
MIRVSERGEEEEGGRTDEGVAFPERRCQLSCDSKVGYKFLVSRSSLLQ